MFRICPGRHLASATVCSLELFSDNHSAKLAVCLLVQAWLTIVSVLATFNIGKDRTKDEGLRDADPDVGYAGGHVRLVPSLPATYGLVLFLTQPTAPLYLHNRSEERECDRSSSWSSEVMNMLSQRQPCTHDSAMLNNNLMLYIYSHFMFPIPEVDRFNHCETFCLHFTIFLKPFKLEFIRDNWQTLVTRGWRASGEPMHLAKMHNSPFGNHPAGRLW